MRCFLLILLAACGDKDPTTDSAASAEADTDTDTDTDSDTDTDTDTEPLPDADGDGSPDEEDCEDADASVYPGAPELCNGLDEDCDGAISGEEDSDGDGVLDCEVCANAGVWPGMMDVTDDASMEALFSETLTERACIDYTDERDYLFGTLDSVGGEVEGLYTGARFAHDPKAPDWKTVNTEHVWPRSDGAQYEPVECDLHHLFPADALVNNYRGSLPFGVVVLEDWSGGGSRKGEDASGVDVFEPRDERKGDVARAMLYIAARYPNQADIEAQRPAAQLSMFQSWHVSDPPDAAEIARTRAIEARQGHANPFVLCPELAGRL